MLRTSLDATAPAGKPSVHDLRPAWRAAGAGRRRCWLLARRPL